MWRLLVLQQLLPLHELKWRWKEALTILHAAPSKLLNLCMEKAKYDIGEEAVHRFSLSYEDRATLALAEWVDDTFNRASVGDAVSRATSESATSQEIDFSSLRSQIGSIAAILLCVDVAAASAKSKKMSERLLDQIQVHFFLKRKDSNLSDAEVSRLNSWALGLRVLSALPLPWQQGCSSLHEHPQLIFQVLLMRKQLESASLILKEFPSLRDNNVILKYGTKAITVSITSPPRETRISVSGPRLKQKTKTATPIKSSLTSSLSNLQKEARRAFSWTPRSAADKVPPKEPYRKRKSSVLTPSEKVAWEAMTGIQEDHVSSSSADGQDRLPSVSVAQEWMLTGDQKKDDAVRCSHSYDTAPDIILFKEDSISL